jgi:hypothetical protein
VGSWRLNGVGPTLAMAFATALAWRCTNDQILFVLILFFDKESC